MSGFRMPGFCVLGPREEKEVIAGAGDVPRTVPRKVNCAIGLAAVLM
jgi:hypothetical protein